MMCINSIGLKTCSACKYRFTCGVRPCDNDISFEEFQVRETSISDRWIEKLISSKIHSVHDFGDWIQKRYGLKCLNIHAGTMLNRDGIRCGIHVILQDSFISELSEYYNSKRRGNDSR